jgi:hypothetical protein
MQNFRRVAVYMLEHMLSHKSRGLLSGANEGASTTQDANGRGQWQSLSGRCSMLPSAARTTNIIIRRLHTKRGPFWSNLFFLLPALAGRSDIP